VGDVPDVGAVVDLVREAFEEGASRDTGPSYPIPDFPHVPHDQPRYQVCKPMLCVVARGARGSFRGCCPAPAGRLRPAWLGEQHPVDAA
jgi:hypothetical protein